jgi:N-hydroxyarylamine O-acetyltransferase
MTDRDPRSGVDSRTGPDRAPGAGSPDDGDSPTLDPGRYLRRVGLGPAVDPAAAESPARALGVATDREALARLVVAHLHAVPFETLSITGAPDDEGRGPGVELALPALYRKVVERRRGGFCFELNGLFGRLLSVLGFETHRVAGMVLPDEGAPSPANHHANVVHLDRPYLVDVGTGTHAVRRPVPLDGTPVADERGTRWRVAASDRPDCEYRLERRGEAVEGGRDDDPDGRSDDADGDGDAAADGWTTAYVLDDEPRALSYFEATCEYLATAPESTFTGDPVVVDRTPDGYRKLTADALVTVTDAGRTETPVARAEWRDVLRERFDLRVPER